MESLKTHLVTIRQLSRMLEYSAVFTEARLRTLIAAAEPRPGARGQSIPGNGLKDTGAIVRIGRRIYFDLSRFEAWVNSKPQRLLSVPMHFS